MASWTITYPLPTERLDEMPSTGLDSVLWECFRHFAHLDEANAALHTAQTRYSPLTFRLAEQLHAMGVYPDLAPEGVALLNEVMRHLGRYTEDRGR